METNEFSNFGHNQDNNSGNDWDEPTIGEVDVGCVEN